MSRKPRGDGERGVVADARPGAPPLASTAGRDHVTFLLDALALAWALPSFDLSRVIRFFCSSTSFVVTARLGCFIMNFLLPTRRLEASGRLGGRG